MAMQGLRIKFRLLEDLWQIVGIDGAGEAFGFDSAFPGCVLAEKTEGQAANGGEVRSAVAVLLAARVLVEGDVQHPVLTVLNRPVLADRVGQRFGFGWQAAEVQTRLPMFRLRHLAARDDDGHSVHDGGNASAEIGGTDIGCQVSLKDHSARSVSHRTLLPPLNFWHRPTRRGSSAIHCVLAAGFVSPQVSSLIHRRKFGDVSLVEEES